MNKPFVWSWSAISTFSSCPKQFEQTVLHKNFSRPSSQALDRGAKVHEVIARWLVDPTEETTEALRRHVQRAQFVEDLTRRLTDSMGPPLVERRVGVTAQWEPCDFFADDVWGRGVLDAVWLTEDKTHGCVIDWKTGRSTADPTQLDIVAALAFAALPELKELSAGFAYIDARDDKVFATAQWYERAFFDDVRANGLEALNELLAAVDAGTFSATPGRACQWCPVSTCRYFRGGLR